MANFLKKLFSTILAAMTTLFGIPVSNITAPEDTKLTTVIEYDDEETILVDYSFNVRPPEDNGAVETDVDKGSVGAIEDNLSGDSKSGSIGAEFLSVGSVSAAEVSGAQISDTPISEEPPVEVPTAERNAGEITSSEA